MISRKSDGPLTHSPSETRPSCWWRISDMALSQLAKSAVVWRSAISSHSLSIARMWASHELTRSTGMALRSTSTSEGLPASVMSCPIPGASRRASTPGSPVSWSLRHFKRKGAIEYRWLRSGLSHSWLPSPSPPSLRATPSPPSAVAQGSTGTCDAACHHPLPFLTTQPFSRATFRAPTTE